MTKLTFTILLTIVCATLSVAQIDSLDLPEVMIEEGRLSIDFDERSRTINIITREDIQAAPVQSVAELLSYTTGVDIRRRGVNGVQADVSLRGGTFDQVLILLNGVLLNDPQTGHHSLNLPVSLDAIERIEVLKGPGARVYGQNAFAGAINIVTKIADEDGGEMGTYGGSFDSYGLHVSIQDPGERYSQAFYLRQETSEGYRYNTDYNIYNLFYQSEYKVGGGTMHLQAGFTERKFGANGFYASPDFVDQYEEIQTSIVSVEYRKAVGNWSLKPRLYWRRNQDEYIFVRFRPDIYRNLHIGNNVGVALNTSNSNRLGDTGLGLDLRRESLASNNLGSRERYVATASVEHRFYLLDNRLDVTPGALLNYFSDFGTHVFPGVDVGYRLNNRWKAYANAGYTYRVPTYTDLYYADPINIGNPDLQPESAFTYEGGVTYSFTGVRLQAAYFSRFTDDLIDWTRADDTQPWQPSNFSQATTQGAEVSLELFPQRLATELVPITRLDLSATYLDATLGSADDATDLNSRYSLDNLKWQVIAGMDVRLYRKLMLNLRYRYLDRVTLGDYQLADAGLRWQNRRFRLFAEVNNAFDEMYTETNLVPMPGRAYRFGVVVMVK